MDIREAISKAGPGGKIRRDERDSCYVVGDESITFDAGITEVVFHPDELTATDWQVVEPEVIEVGDIVECIHCPGEAIVIGLNDRFVCYQYTLSSDRELNTNTRDNLTLIRKGPKKHVFEGVNWMGVHGGAYPTGMGVGTKLIPFIKDGKTYRMTLEPME